MSEDNLICRTESLDVASVVCGYEAFAAVQGGKALDGLWSQEHQAEGWKALRAALEPAWREVAQFSNWVSRELAKLDSESLIDGTSKAGNPVKKLPPFRPDQKPLYHRGKALFPTLDPCIIATILNRIVGDYKRERFETRILLAKSIHTYRFPQPLPLREKSIRLCRNDRRQFFVRFKIGTARFTARLGSGPDFGRQLAALEHVVKGTGTLGQMILDGQHTINAAARGTDRAETGANRGYYRVMARIAVTRPRPEVSERSRTLALTTCAESFWVAAIGNDLEEVKADKLRPAWTLNADHVRRIIRQIEGQQVNNQRLREDLKFERRANPRLKGQMHGAMDRASEKQKRRLRSFIQESVAALVKYAIRNKVGVVLYDDAVRDFVPSFPWFMLNARLEEQLEARGIRVVRPGAEGRTVTKRA